MNYYYNSEMKIQVCSRYGHENHTGCEAQHKRNKFKLSDRCVNQTPWPTGTPLTTAEIKTVK